jgi:hypothetical protein
LDRKKISGDKSTQFDYDEITGKIIQATLLLEYESIEVLAKIEWIEDMEYPLMFVEKIKERE